MNIWKEIVIIVAGLYTGPGKKRWANQNLLQYYDTVKQLAKPCAMHGNPANSNRWCPGLFYSAQYSNLWIYCSPRQASHLCCSLNFTFQSNININHHIVRFISNISCNAIWLERELIHGIRPFFIREGCRKSKWKLKMAFAMKGGWVSRGSRVPHTYFEKWFLLKTI